MAGVTGVLDAVAETLLGEAVPFAWGVVADTGVSVLPAEVVVAVAPAPLPPPVVEVAEVVAVEVVDEPQATAVTISKTTLSAVKTSLDRSPFMQIHRSFQTSIDAPHLAGDLLAAQ